jgi:uncharacterized protein YecT (DUF1311 family)
MKNLSGFSAAFCLVLLAGGIGCRESKKAAPEVATATQDTMLLRDLAEANKNTAAASALDNSLSNVRTTEGPLDQTAQTPTTQTQVVSRPPATSNPALTASRISTQSPSADTGARTTPSKATRLKPTTSGDYCDSPAPADQRSCLNRSIVENDADLNRTYQELLAQSEKSGGPDLEERLRQSQREWVNTRDSECLEKTSGQGGALWARPRARCLAEYSAKRTAELQRTLSSLRGQ